MFIPAQRISKVQKSVTRRLYDGAPAGSVNFGLGEPDFRTPEVVRREATRALEHEPLGYTANAGLMALREQVAAYTNEGAGTRYTAEHVCVTNGTQEALFAVVMAAVGPGDEVLLPDPCFNAYATLVEIAGARATRFRMPAARRFELDRESFAAALSERTKLVFINSPSNPTGRVLSRDDLRFLAGALEGTGAYAVADEIYRDLYFGERPASLAEYFERTVIVSGLSKMMSMTGWRLGWAVGPAEVIAPVTVMHQYVSTCASALSQRAAMAAFGEEGRRATAAMREELRRRRDVMTRAIDREIGLPYTVGEGAYYVMLDVGAFGESEKTAWALLKERVITVPGSAFGAESEGYLRLSFSIDGALIEEGVRRMARGFEKLRAR